MTILREVCFLIGQRGQLLWSDASTSPVALPDSRVRWQRIWGARDELVHIAHSHPLGGAAFSSIDETTMSALDTALGRRLIYSVTTPHRMLLRTHADDTTSERIVDVEPWWVPLLRVASGIGATTKRRCPLTLQPQEIAANTAAEL